MSLLASFQSGLKEACLDYRDCCGPLIITCSSLLLANRFCSMHTQMNINATEDDSHLCVCVCVPLEHTQTDADRRQKLERHARRHTKRNTHTPCVLSVLCQVRRLSLPLQLRGGRKKAWYVARAETHTHAASFPDTLSQRRRDGKRKRISF